MAQIPKEIGRARTQAQWEGKPQTRRLFSEIQEKDYVARENVGSDKRGNIHLMASICSKQEFLMKGPQPLWSL